MHDEQLLLLTKWLLNKIDECESRYVETREKKVTFSFYDEIKPYCDEIHVNLDKWEGLVLRWIKEGQPKYLTKAQILNCKEHIEQIAVQSFFHETSLKRFKDVMQSATFILQNILSQINTRQKRTQ